jgi:hypothetical protein
MRIARSVGDPAGVHRSSPAAFLTEEEAMTLLSLCLITTWMVLVVLGTTLAGFVHALLGAAVVLVILTGKRNARRARVAAATAAAAATTAAAAASSLPLR